MRTTLLLLTAAVTLTPMAGCGESKSPTSSDAASSVGLSAASGLPSEVQLENAGTTLAGSNGREVDVNDERITGYIEKAVVNGDELDISGWAAHTDLSSPAIGVAALVDDKSVRLVRLKEARPDLVRKHGSEGLASAGFALSVPVSALDCGRPDGDLEVYAGIRGAAAPLAWRSAAREAVERVC